MMSKPAASARTVEVHNCPNKAACPGSNLSVTAEGRTSSRSRFCAKGYEPNPGCTRCAPGYGRLQLDPFTCHAPQLLHVSALWQSFEVRLFQTGMWRGVLGPAGGHSRSLRLHLLRHGIELCKAAQSHSADRQGRLGIVRIRPTCPSARRLVPVVKMLEAQTSLVCQLVPALLVSPWQSFHSPEVLLSFVTISARSLSAVRHTRHDHQLLCPGLRYGSCVRGDTKTKSHLIGSA